MSAIDTAKLRALLAAATPGPWTRGHNPEHYEPLAYFAEAYRYGTPGTIHLVCVPVEGKDINDEALFTAITGNGPTSEANAALIAAAVNAMPALLDELEALRVERDAATSRAKQYLLNSYEETAAWRTATGCDTPEEAARVVSVFDEATHLARGQREELIAANRDLGRLAMRQQAELDRLRELRDALLAWCASTRVAHVRDTREEQRLDRAIAAEHVARAKKAGG